MPSKMRTPRYAKEVWTPTGIVDVIRFEDYIEKNKSFCRRKNMGDNTPLPCKIEGKSFPCKECTGCIFHSHVYELGILTTCFEVKISVSDFKSKNGHNFHGNKNYYVVPVDIAKAVEPLVPKDIGLIKYYPESECMSIVKECEFKGINPETLNCLLYNALKKWM